MENLPTTFIAIYSIAGGATIATVIGLALLAVDITRFRKAKESRDVKKNGIGDPPLWV